MIVMHVWLYVLVAAWVGVGLRRSVRGRNFKLQPSAAPSESTAGVASMELVYDGSLTSVA
jgi:hypothetical protein